MEVEGKLLEKKGTGGQKVREDDGVDKIQAWYTCMHMSQWNPLFCVTNMS